MSFNETYSKGLYSLGFKYVEWYKQQIITIASFKAKSRREILTTIYYQMIKNDDLKPLESLPEAQKKEIWEEVKPHTRELSKNDSIKVAKAVYALNALAEKKEVKEPPKVVKRSADDI